MNERMIEKDRKEERKKGRKEERKKGKKKRKKILFLCLI
jgi:hypothetical protein